MQASMTKLRAEKLWVDFSFPKCAFMRSWFSLVPPFPSSLFLFVVFLLATNCCPPEIDSFSLLAESASTSDLQPLLPPKFTEFSWVI